MIAVVSRRPVLARPFLEELAIQSRDGVESPHAHGYAAAILTNGHWLHVREQCPIWEGNLEALGVVRGTVMILHSRKASDTATINITKQHPFCWAGDGVELMFCQNGTIRQHGNITCSVGDCAIDTEKYFDVVIRHYKKAADLGKAIENAATEIEACGANATSLNCLASDGRSLVAYKGKILEENKNYHTLFAKQTDAQTIVSTEPFRKDPGGWGLIDGIFQAKLSD